MRGQQRNMAPGTRGVCALLPTQPSKPLLLFGMFRFLSFSLFVIGIIYCGWIAVLQGGILITPALGVLQ